MKKIAATSLLLIFLSSFAFAGTIDLPQTGQIRCYNSAGTEISCAGTGQDGDIQAGVEWPSPRFSVSRDVVTDNLTGLMWTKDANLPGTGMEWQQALDYVSGMNSSTYPNYSYTDWRLPNINELESLVNCGVENPAAWLQDQGFTNVQAMNYWSSTTVPGSSGYAWELRLYEGGWISTGYKSPDMGDYVWPVRGGGSTSFPAPVWRTGQTVTYSPGDDGDLQKGIAWPNPRFTDKGNGAVTDNLTGLMWTKDARITAQKLWQEALDYVAGMNAGTGTYGYKDWRLPNRKELYSLINFPNQPSWPFINVQLPDYWSSTTFAVDVPWGGTDFAWITQLLGGYVHVDHKSPTTYYYVWPVRGGQSGSFDNWVISGSVTSNGTGLSGVTMTLAGSGAGTTTTNSSGNYTFSGLSNGTYTVTPSKSGYTFSPTSTSLTISGVNQTGINFTASSGGSCTSWDDVMNAFMGYVGGSGTWDGVMQAYQKYITNPC